MADTNTSTGRENMPTPSKIGCPKGCYDMDWCLASLIVPCAIERNNQPDPSGQFNMACGHLKSGTCGGCGVCTVCDGCYCGEE